MNKEPFYFFFKNIKINNINESDIFPLVENILSTRGSGYMCLTDVGNVMMGQKDVDLARAINRSNVSIADGAPLSWYGKLIGLKNIKRLSGVDLFSLLVHNTSYKHFLLGDTHYTQNKIIKKAKKIRSDLKMEGYSPPFKKVFSERDNNKILRILKKSQPDLIWVSLGGRKQEKWMMQSIERIDHGVMFGIGAAFRYYTGELIKPPKLIQTLGFQWVTRLINEPKRWIIGGPLKFRFLFCLQFPFELLKNKTYQ